MWHYISHYKYINTVCFKGVGVTSIRCLATVGRLRLPAYLFESSIEVCWFPEIQWTASSKEFY